MGATAAIATTIASTGISTINTIQGSVNQAASQKLQARIEAQQLETNSRLAEVQAKDAEIRGKKESENYKRNIKKLIGSQRAALAAQGIDIGSGSALEIQLETAEFGALDAQTIRNNAFIEATGYRIQSIDYQNRARFTELAGRNKARNTLITGGLTAVSGLASGIGKLDEFGAFD